MCLAGLGERCADKLMIGRRPFGGMKRLNLFLFSVRELRQQLTTPLIVLLTILRTFAFMLTDTQAHRPIFPQMTALEGGGSLLVIFTFSVTLSLISE